MQKILSGSLFLLSLSLSTAAYSQPVEVVTDQLTQQYGLDFSDVNQQGPFRLVIGSNGALYLRDNATGNFEKISKRRNGVPAPIINNSSSKPNYEAAADYSKIAYVSEDPFIVSGDSGNSQDVFIYDRNTGQTVRVEGYQPHQGSASNLRISPTGDHVVFESDDRAFGNVGDNYLDALLYVYDLNSELLTAIPAPPDAEPFYPDENYNSLVTAENVNYNRGISGKKYIYDAFTIDGKKLFFNEYSVNINFGDSYIGGYYTYNLEDGTYARIENTSSPDYTDDRPEVVALGDNKYLYVTWDLNDAIFPINIPSIYNSSTNRLTDIYPSGGFNFILGERSESKRFAVFYSTRGNYADDSTEDPTAGVLLVMDTHSGEIRPAFAAPRKALSFYNGDQANGPYNCYLFYIINPDFYATPIADLPCNSSNGINLLATTHDDYITRSIEAYDLATNNVHFHNQDRYLTFEANSWFLDRSIPLNAYDYQRYSNTTTQRDTFVVANPFLTPSVVDGKPAINRATDTGWFIWRESGRWHNEFVAGGTRQTFDGGVDSSSGAFASAVSVEFQSGDKLISNGNIFFQLNVTGPWYDGFSFVTEPGAQTCAYLNSPTNAIIYLGPDRIPMPNGVELETQQACDPPQMINTFGRPTINRSLDNGIFIWQTQTNRWRVEAVSSSTNKDVYIDVESEENISQVQQISIESSDQFNISPMALNLRLNVSPPWIDGFKFTVENGSNTCLKSRSSFTPIYVGSERINVGRSLNLQTLIPCP